MHDMDAEELFYFSTDLFVLTFLTYIHYLHKDDITKPAANMCMMCCLIAVWNKSNITQCYDNLFITIKKCIFFVYTL